MAWMLKNWMSAIDDDKSLAHISIPGSHDSLATQESLAFDLASGVLGGLGSFVKLVDEGAKLVGLPTIRKSLDSAIAKNVANAQTTTKSISDQLSAGIRFFDFRFRLADNQLWGQHGMVPMKISGRTAINQIDDYLDKYPSETVIVNIQEENKGGQATSVKLPGWSEDLDCSWYDVPCHTAQLARDQSWAAVRGASGILSGLRSTWNPAPTKETNIFKVTNFKSGKDISFDVNVNDWVNNNISFTKAVEKDLIDSLPGKEKNWFLENRVPTLEEVRGKIVMINNFDQDKSIGLLTGGHLSGNSGEHLWFDNKWEGISKENKLKRNIESMNDINNDAPERLSVVFTSASSEDSRYQPKHYSNYSNPRLLGYFKSKSGQIGTVAGDFFDADLAMGIIQTNHFAVEGSAVADEIVGLSSLGDSLTSSTNDGLLSTDLKNNKSIDPLHLELDGDVGDDVIIGKKGNDIIKGGSGDDKLRGKQGDDTLHGGAGGDKIIGGKGDDMLNGGGNKDCEGDVECVADVLVGGRGADAFVLNKGEVIINDFTGKDQLMVPVKLATPDSLVHQQDGNHLLLLSPNGLNTMILNNTFETVVDYLVSV